MKEFTNRIPAQGKANRKKITYSDNSEEYVFIENADEPTTGNEGTPINRNNLMALQGFQNNNIVISTNNDNERVVTETNSDNHTLVTTFNSDGTITQTFTGAGGITLTKDITIGNGKISEEMRNV